MAPTFEHFEKQHFGFLSLFFFISWFLFLLWACMTDGVYWLMFQIAFVLLGALPFVFKSHESHGTWGAVGDFTAGMVSVSLFAFPSVLHNANKVVGDESLALATLSSIWFCVGVLCFSRMVSME
jgi:hypothetical protein